MDFYKLLEEKLGSTVTDEKVYATLKSDIEKLHAEDVAGLKTNNDKLLNEKKEYKGKLETLEEQLKGLGDKSIEAVLTEKAQLEKDIEELRANPGDAVKLKQLEDVYKTRLTETEKDREAKLKIKADELADAVATNTALNLEINGTQCLTELQAHLDAIGVQLKYKKVVSGFLLPKLSVELVEGIRKVKYKNDAGISFDIKEGIEYWAKQDDAKPFIGAPINAGGGASGSGSVTNTLMSKDFGKMTGEEKTTLYKVNPELYNRKRADFKAMQ